MKRYKVQTTGAHISFSDIVRANRKPLLILLGIIIAVVVGVIVIYNVVSYQSFSSSFLVTGDTIKIGVRTDVPGFGGVDEDGNITGYDRDYIDEALRRMMPNQSKLIEYVPITSQNAGASIKYGTANICLGLLVDGTDRTKGFRLTKPYYTDNVVAVVPGTSRLDKLTNLDGGKLGVFSAAIPPEDVEDYLKKNNLEYDILRYSDYESAMSDIENGRVNAVVLPYAVARQFEAAGFRILAEPLYQVGYCVMLPTGQAAFTTEMNKVIEEMERDGTAAELRFNWGLL